MTNLAATGHTTYRYSFLLIFGDIMRHYTDQDRIKSAQARLANALEHPVPDYPLDREPGQIIHIINRQILIVDLMPKGRCVQHLARFPDGSEILAGLNGIHAEIRKRMPPLLGWRNL